MTKAIHFPASELADRNHALFDELVPPMGPSDTLAGEIVRAANRICYRWYNDGDELGVGYGNETVNPAARFLEDVCQQKSAGGSVAAGHVADAVRRLWDVSGRAHGPERDERYSAALVGLVASAVALVESSPELRSEPGCDFFDWADPEWDSYREEWDEEDEQW